MINYCNPAIIAGVPFSFTTN